MNRFLFGLLTVLLAAPALAQSVQQSGTVTPGHVPAWVTSGVIRDGGSATSSNITEMGVTKNGGIPFSINSANTGALTRLYQSVTGGAATIGVTSIGGASDGTLTFNMNGNSVTLPATPGGTIVPTVTTTPSIADSAPVCFSGTGGTLKNCGGTPGTGTVTSITAGTGIAASPDPITTTGTISLAPIADGNLLGNSSGSSAAPSAQAVGSGLSLSAGMLAIGTASVTNAMLANMANGTVKCRATSGTGAPEDCTITQIFGLLGSPAQGDIIYFNGSLTPTLLPAANNGEFLQTQGAGANPVWASAGKVAQQVTNSYTTNTSLSNGAIPLDDTIPQIGEGTAIVSQSITPTNASSTLSVLVEFNCGGATGTGCVAALFRDATADAVATGGLGAFGNNAGLINSGSFGYSVAAGSTSSTTFSVRAGGASGTVYTNGNSGGRYFGGTVAWRITITEVLP